VQVGDVDAALAAEPQAEAAVEAADPVVEPTVEAPAEPEAQEAREVGGKPDITPGRPVTAYSAAQLEALVRWIDADSGGLSDEELLRAAMKELGFSRLGPRIKEALGAAISAARG
jgi:hypothetical protein